MKSKQTVVVVEIAVMVAFAYVLNLLRVISMPQGGSVSLAMLPIFVVALRWGAFPGMVAGLLFSGALLITDPYVVHPAQALLDYPVAFAGIGLAGWFRDKPLAGIVVGGAARLLSHFVSGVVFFAAYAPAGQHVFWYSLLYNISYLGPEILITILVAPLVMKRVMPEGAPQLELRRNLLEIATFTLPLVAVAALLALPTPTILRIAAGASWAVLVIYHLWRARLSTFTGWRGVWLATVPPFTVLAMYYALITMMR